MEICVNRDAALIHMAEQRGLLSAQVAERLRMGTGARSAALALVEDGHLGADVVRALRAELLQQSIDHAIDGYELLGKLGSGGTSEVFKATDVVNRKLVAFKVISSRMADDGLFLERFRREARSAAAVIHPNVVGCYGIGETQGKAYMVLEYMPGGDLVALLKSEGGRLSEGRALPIAVDCASGLEAIHAHELVHRDIKPSNILLDGSGTAKLADLGLAKSAAADDPLAKPGTCVGSPGYMSPEQAGGLAHLDIRSDIYSLGATLYHLLSGQCAFTGRSPAEIIVRSMREEPPPLFEVAPWVLPHIAAIVAKCMAHHPRDRYHDPTELREELIAAMNRNRAVASASTAYLPPSAPPNRQRRQGRRAARPR